MKIAIVSTGLGHVSRGIEAWALALARGLAGEAGVTPQVCGPYGSEDSNQWTVNGGNGMGNVTSNQLSVTSNQARGKGEEGGVFHAELAPAVAESSTENAEEERRVGSKQWTVSGGNGMGNVTSNQLSVTSNQARGKGEEGRRTAEPQRRENGGQPDTECRERSGNNEYMNEEVEKEKIEVTLFGTVGAQSREILSGLRSQVSGFISLPCLKRNDWIVRAWVKLAPGFTWRWGWTSGYSIEQKSFAKHIIPYLQSGEYDVVHTQDVTLALELEKARRKGIIMTPTILAHGTDENMDLLGQFEFVQHLSPEHERKEESSRKGAKDAKEEGRRWVIPNFVDVARFQPLGKEEEERFSQRRKDIREKFNIPVDAFVVGCSAALQSYHKRLDYLIREVARGKRPFGPAQDRQGVSDEREGAVDSKQPPSPRGWVNPVEKSFPSSPTARPEDSPYLSSTDYCSLSTVYLLLAGAETNQTPALEQLAHELLGDRCKILKNLPFDEMPDFYRALDVYIHPAAEEFFGICFLEAMACGVPVVAHDAETLRWIVGGGEVRRVSSKQSAHSPASTNSEQVGSGQSVNSERLISNPVDPVNLVRKLSSANSAPPCEGSLVSGFSPTAYRLPLTPYPSSPSGGRCLDMNREGAVAEFLRDVTPEWIEMHGRQARERVEKMFSWEAVKPKFLEMYGEVVRERVGGNQSG